MPLSVLTTPTIPLLRKGWDVAGQHNTGGQNDGEDEDERDDHQARHDADARHEDRRDADAAERAEPGHAEDADGHVTQP